jgi:hypothetical protein
LNLDHGIFLIRSTRAFRWAFARSISPLAVASSMCEETDLEDCGFALCQPLLKLVEDLDHSLKGSLKLAELARGEKRLL